MKNKKIIFVHGYTATPKEDFYPALRPLLDQEGIEYLMPLLPGGYHPHSKDWLDVIDDEVQRAGDAPLILVGHSLGARAVLLYLDLFHTAVDAVILVAAFNNDYELNRTRRDEYYADFFEHPVDTELIKTLAKKIIVLHSTDDESIPVSQGQEIAKQLDADLVRVEGHNHFTDAADAAPIFEQIKRAL